MRYKHIDVRLLKWAKSTDCYSLTVDTDKWTYATATVWNSTADLLMTWQPESIISLPPAQRHNNGNKKKKTIDCRGLKKRAQNSQGVRALMSTTEKESSQEPHSPWRISRVEGLPKTQPQTPLYEHTQKHAEQNKVGTDKLNSVSMSWGQDMANPPDLIKALLLSD